MTAAKTCATCKHAERDIYNDIICVNADSPNCTEFVGEGESCGGWTENENRN